MPIKDLTNPGGVFGLPAEADDVGHDDGWFDELTVATMRVGSQSFTLDLDDVQPNDTLRYNATTEKWENVAGVGSGDVVGPETATDNALARFDTTTGTLLQDSPVTLSDTGDMAGVNDLSMSGDLTMSGALAGVTTLDAESLTVTTGAEFQGPVTGISLSEIEDLEGDKTFTMANRTITWQFTNPNGGMEWNFTGAAAGHSLAIHQTGGNPGTSMHLLHIEAADVDPTLLHLHHGSGTSRALDICHTTDTTARLQINGDGLLEWGPGGSAAVDTNLYRSAVDTLKTDDAFRVGLNLRVRDGGGTLEVLMGSVVSGNAGVTFGADTNIYRSAADTLKTDDDFQAQRVSVGQTPPAAQLFAIGGTHPSTATTVYGFLGNFVAPSTATGNVIGMHVNARTQAASFNVGNIIGFNIGSPSLGSGSSSTTVRGLSIDAQNVGTTSYGIDVGTAGTYGIAVKAAGTSTLWLSSDANNTTESAGIAFGQSRDTTLYRSSAGRLKTGAQFDAAAYRLAGSIVINTDGTFTLAGDAYISGVAASTSTMTRLLTGATGDTSGRFALLADGSMSWGPGNASRDVTLYRSAADNLKTDDSFNVGGSYFRLQGASCVFDALSGNAGGDAFMRVRVTGDTQNRYFADYNGTYLWGSGSAAPDVNLGRAGVNALSTNGAFTALSLATSNGPLNLTLSGATTSALIAKVSGDAQNRFIMDASGKMLWGSGALAGDVNLYRSAANVLKTDDAFDAASYLVGGTPMFSSAGVSLVPLGTIAVFNARGRETVDYQALETNVTGDDYLRWYVTASGRQDWGDGSGSMDVRLQRTGAGILAIQTQANNIGIQFTTSGVFSIADGVSAPTTTAGLAHIYVDSSDGDLKVKFGDGTVKVIAADT
jgi:hypothetical protein